MKKLVWFNRTPYSAKTGPFDSEVLAWKFTMAGNKGEPISGATVWCEEVEDSSDRLGRVAFEQHRRNCDSSLESYPWDKLGASAKEHWISVAKAVIAENVEIKK